MPHRNHGEPYVPLRIVASLAQPLIIEEHYTDTGGVSDHVFGLCHLFGFRFAPRMRDIKERKLYLLRLVIQAAHGGVGSDRSKCGF